MADKKLTVKQTQFIKYYLSNGFNATQAAISAGHSKRTASEIGYENLRKPQIAEEISKAFKGDGIVVQSALRELNKMIGSDFTDFVEIDDLTGVITVRPLEDIPDGMTTIIKKIKQNRIIKQVHGAKKTEDIVLDDRVEYELPDKLKAIDIVLKLAGQYTEKVSLTVENGLEDKLRNMFEKHGESKIDEFFKLFDN